jgi:hypothetical protein
MAYNVVTKSPRAPTIAAPGSKGNTRPTAQKGGGGNKAAGSVEPTAANTPTVSVSPTGVATPEHFGPSPAAQRAARQATVAARESRRRVQRVKSYVRQRDQELTPKREVKVSKAFLDRQASPKPVTVAAHKRGETEVTEHQRSLPRKPESPLIAKGYTKAEREVLAEGGVKVPKTPKAPKEPKLKGTPQERKAARARVRQAKREVRASKPVIEADLGPEQERFVKGVAKETGLNLRTIAAQARAEESEGAQTEAEQTHNFLNMGPGIRYASLKEGIDATAHNYNHGPYEGVRATRGQPAAVQAKAIAESPWGTGPLIEETLNSVHVKPGNPEAVKNYRQAIQKAKALGMKVGSPSPGVQAQGNVVYVHQTAKTALQYARKNIGVSTGSPQEVNWATQVGGVTSPWCAVFASAVLKREGIEPPANPSYSGAFEEGWKGGTKLPTTELAKAKPGDLLIFDWGDGGQTDHVAFYAGNGKMLGGNQGAGEVSEDEVPAGNVVAIVRPHWNGKKVPMKAGSTIPVAFTPSGGVVEAPAAVAAVASPTGVPTGTGKDQGHGKPPRQLTPLQQINRRVNQLKRLGVEVAAPGQETKAEVANKPGDSSLHAQLAKLEAKYSIGAV